MESIRPTTSMSFVDMYKQFLTPIYQFVFYRTGGNTALAEDLCQEIFCKAYEAMQKNLEIIASKSWIYRIAQNHIIDHYRAKSGKETLSIEEYDMPHDDNIVETLLQNEEQQEVFTHLHKLPQRQQDLLILRYINQASIQELADMHGTSEGAIRVRIHEAVKALRHIIPAQGDQL